ncbi:MAG: 3-oxoadipate enol-lactonase [Betaproteobacteria bacterium]
MKPVSISCHVSGSGGPAVVLAHAIGCDHRMWDDLEKRLAPSFHVINIDARGHGSSPVPPRPYSLGALAEDVRALLDRLGVAKAHWVGLSMGGMVGQAFALAHPGRLERLVIANSTASYGVEGHTLWHNRIKLVEEGGLAAIRDMVAQRYFSDAFRREHADVVSKVMARFMETPVEGYLGCCDAIRELDFSSHLKSIHAPTLVIAGSEDAGTPVAMSQAIAKGIPGAKLEVIQGAAHLSAVEKPGEFAELVNDFIAAR